MNIIKDLEQRGMIAQCSDIVKLQDLATREQMTVYCGFDPTSDSLTVGNLLALVTLKRFHDAGHTVIVVIGDETALIGDPSGRSKERPLLDSKALFQNIASIQEQIARIVGISGTYNIRQNSTWIKNLTLREFCRDVCSFYSVNAMLEKDSVKSRMDAGGLTFAEMTYSIVQGYDFFYLHKFHSCDLQIGGSDQWGNICSGLDLIGKKTDKEWLDKRPAFGLTFPLLTKTDGTKFGKSSEGNVWLAPEKTSEWDFYCFWINIPDEDIRDVYSRFSQESLDDCKVWMELDGDRPGERILQKRLAHEMTTLVHGRRVADVCRNVSAALFAENWDNIGAEDLKLAAKAVGSISLEATVANVVGKFSVVAALICSGLALSKSDAMRVIESGGVSINSKVVNEDIIELPEMLFDRYLILKKGKKSFKIVERMKS